MIFGAVGELVALLVKADVMVDPYFPRNVLLVGRKGGSFLESGYVYAPYVPPPGNSTIFGTEDFVPRKGVMTRYAKKMVRPDMYGLVVVRGLLGEAGAKVNSQHPIANKRFRSCHLFDRGMLFFNTLFIL